MVMVNSRLEADLSTGESKALLSFCKMQGLGNDFVLVSEDELERALSAYLFESNAAKDEFLSALAEKLCSRNFGIGADGFIVVRKGSSKERLSWTYLNSDGSISLMCGNGLRCLALWAELKHWAPSKNYFVETGKGPVEIRFESPNSISTDLGEPNLIPEEIPVCLKAAKSELAANAEKVVAADIDFGTLKYTISCVNMGNPHCIVYVDDIDCSELEKAATYLQAHPFFPDGVNVEFVKLKSRQELKVVVFERGCGRTLACGSGAAAVAVAAVLESKTERTVKVELDGGVLEIFWNERNNHVQINGPAKLVFEGQIDLRSLNLETSA